MIKIQTPVICCKFISIVYIISIATFSVLSPVLSFETETESVQEKMSSDNKDFIILREISIKKISIKNVK